MKFSDDELIAAIEAEEALSLDSRSGELAAERTDALKRYRGEPLGNEVDGRSQVVSKSVLDTIEMIMPSLVRVYLGGDGIGRFEARGPEDEDAAQVETEVCNWYLEQKNDLFSHINATLRDALLLKNGYMIAQWIKREDVMTETYLGQSDEEATMLMQDPEVEVVEHTQYPDPNAPRMAAPEMNGGATQAPGMPAMPMGQMPAPMLHDLKVERKSAEEFVQVESVPPDEIKVSRRHRWTSLMDADFVQWERRVTIGQLRAEGYDVADDEPEDQQYTQESVTRDRFNENTVPGDESPDPARRIVVFKNTLMRIDMRGNGRPQLWNICHIAGSRKVLRKEEAPIVNIAAFTPIVYPHSHIGSSIYDLINDLSVIETTLLRQYLDGVYQANSGQRAVDIDRVTLDDLLISRPGNIVRVTGDPGTAIVDLVSTDVTQSVLGGLEYIDNVKEQRTGVSRNTVGLDPNALNKTATGTQMQQAAASQRIELIARTLAGGFRDLFLIVHSLACKHSTKPLQIKLKGGWTAVNPREWKRRTDFIIDVGVGTGTPEAQLAKLMGLAPVIAQAQALGLAGVEQQYNFGVEILKAAGYKNPDKFMTPPKRDPQTGQVQEPPPPPNPLVQVEQIKQQGAQAKAQFDAQMHAQELQAKDIQHQRQVALDAQAKQQQQAAELELQRSNDERQAQLDARKFAFDMERADKELAQQREIEAMKIAGELEKERIKLGLDDGLKAAQAMLQEAGMNAQAIVASVHEAVQTLGATLQQHAQAMQAHAAANSVPKRIVRDPQTNRAIGIEPVRH